MKKKGFIVAAIVTAFVLIFSISSVNAKEVLPDDLIEPGIGNTSENSNSTNTNVDLKTVTCGNITGIPKKIPELTRTAITIIEIAVPIVLVIVGMIDLFKAMTANKEDEIKKGQQIFIKRLIAAGLVFFVIAIVKLLISLVDDNNTNIINCIDCFLSKSEACTVETK